MPATITRKAYRYSELGPKGKEAAIEWYREQRWKDGCDCDDSDMLGEMLQTDLEDHFGLNGCKLGEWCCCGCCRNDGVSFSGTVNLNALAKVNTDVLVLLAQYLVIAAAAGVEAPELSCRIKSPDEVTIDSEWWDTEIANPLDAHVSIMEDRLQELVEDVAGELLRIGRAEVEHHDSDEYIGEELEANDCFRFTRKGEYLDI